MIIHKVAIRPTGNQLVCKVYSYGLGLGQYKLCVLQMVRLLDE